MTIDWFTFLAQILNFLILVWLLKRFLYGPIVNAMDQREARIADQLTDAAAAHAAAVAREQQYQQQLDGLAGAREDMLAEAGREVEKWRAQHLHSAKREVETARSEWHRTLAREQQSLLRQLQLDVAHHAVDVARHLLRELGDEQLQSQLVRRFLKLLRNTHPAGFHLLASSHDRALVVESSDPLSDDDRAQVVAAVTRIGGADAEIEFRENPDLVCGIELSAPAGRLAWSVRESLAELESDLIDAIDAAIPAAVAATAPAATSADLDEEETVP